MKTAGSVYKAPFTSQDHCAPSLAGVAAGSVPASVESSLSVKTAVSGVSTPSATVPQCTVAPSSFLANNCRL